MGTEKRPPPLTAVRQWRPEDDPPRQRTPNGAWRYGIRDTAAAVRVLRWGLALEDWDNAIEAARIDGETDRFTALERYRARLLSLLDHDARGERARDAAAHMAGLLREANDQLVLAALRPDAELGARAREQRREAARSTRKLDETQRTRIRAEYMRLVSSGDRRGAVKLLSGRHGVSTKTISGVVADLRPEKNRK